MMKSCVTISLVQSLAGGPWIYWDSLAGGISRAADAGFDAVELFLDDPYSVQVTSLNSALQESGVNLAAVGTGAGKALYGWSLTDPDRNVRSRAFEYIARMIAFGARFRASTIIGSMQGRIAKDMPRERCLDWLAEGLKQLGDIAQSQGVELIFEPLNRYETDIFNRMEDAAAFLTSRELVGVHLLADLFHMNIEEQSLTEAIRDTGEYIRHVHFADSNRRPAGLGHIDMPAVAAALKHVAYGGYLSAEALAYPDSDRAASQTMTTFRKWFQ